MIVDFCSVTELAGDEVSKEQVERLCHRYYWAGTYCKNKDVLEVACGTGQGIGYLASVSKSLDAGDYSNEILAIARKHYGNRFEFQQFNAMNIPFDDNSKDVIVLFEAIYYIPDVEKFIRECRRVLRKGGTLLIVTANKDLYDFNPSPHSFTYLGVMDMNTMLERFGFSCLFFGYIPINKVSIRQKILRPLKKLAVTTNIMPGTMASKKFLKSLMFGRLVPMPAEIGNNDIDFVFPDVLDKKMEDKLHKVIYCCATLS